jgi:hypothetical protein
MMEGLLDASLIGQPALVDEGKGVGVREAVEGDDRRVSLELGFPVNVGQDGDEQVLVRDGENAAARGRPELGELVQQGRGMMLLPYRGIGEIDTLKQGNNPGRQAEIAGNSLAHRDCYRGRELSDGGDDDFPFQNQKAF